MDNTPTKKTILLADDDQFIAVVYKDGLEQAGYSVVVAHDGEEALAQIRAIKPDLVLLDIIMPKQNGFEVLQALQADPTVSTIPVIVLTNLSQESDELEARKFGATDFLVKSNISLNDLLARIDHLFSPV